ncbi:MAG: histidine kinase [Ignavibacteriales bacterium]|nr:histidine kinase [Ignavibacteriales bacterium]
MRTFILLLLSLFLLPFTFYPQCKIELVVVSKLSGDQNVFIAGNKPELGNWNPDKTPLNKINDSTWSKSFEFMADDIIEFKFTLGSWEKEALNKWGEISGNNSLKILTDTTLILNIDDWGNSHKNVSGQITGNVKYHRNFEARRVLPRDIIVWLPPSYDSLPNKYYPVLYMQDGQNLFDPTTSSFGIDWQMDETADSLIRSYAMQEIIIVGIYNSINRGKEYNHTNLGEAYIQFIVEELKPFIDVTYRTLPDKKNTAVGGSSSGGLISFIIAWEYSDIFSKAACISPAFKISDINYIAPISDFIGAKKEIKIYIDNGGIGIEEKLQPGIDEMLNSLEEKGFVEGKDLLFVKDQNAGHNESDWAKRVYRFLEFLFPINN